MLDQAFNRLLGIHRTAITMRRFDGSGGSITTAAFVSPSNYFKNQAGPSATVIKGREFVMSTASIAAPFTPIIKRGDRIEHPVFGNLAIEEIIEMHDLGGIVMGYRIRVE